MIICIDLPCHFSNFQLPSRATIKIRKTETFWHRMYCKWEHSQRSVFSSFFVVYDAIAWDITQESWCINILQVCPIRFFKKMIPLIKQSIIIIKYADLSVHSILENTIYFELMKNLSWLHFIVHCFLMYMS